MARRSYSPPGHDRTVQTMPKPRPTEAALIREAEISAEGTIAIVRLGVGAMLAVAFAISVLPAMIAAGTGSFRQIAMATATIGGYLALGLVSRRMARPGRWRPVYAWLFASADVALLLVGVASTMTNTGMPSNLMPLVPALWLLPIVMASGALRYDPWLQSWMATLAIGGLVAIGWETFRFGPVPLDPLDLDFMTHVPPTVMRLVMLVAFAAILVLAAWRSRALLARALEEGRRRAEVTRFMPAPIADHLADVGLDALRAGRRQPVAVLFVDIRGFTAWAESRSPDVVGDAIAEFRARVADVADRHGGVIDKFIGDGAMIVFGIPAPAANDAARAVACAIDLLGTIAALSVDRMARGLDGLRIGIGAHAGEVYCGAIGDARRVEFTVIGDTVNTAARLESAGKDVGFALLASTALAEAAGLAPTTPGWVDLPAMMLRGRAHPIDVRAFAPNDPPGD
jgi:adenylate cyclase